MSVKTKLARKAVKKTAKHTAHGAFSKIERKPFRSLTLLAVGVLLNIAERGNRQTASVRDRGRGDGRTRAAGTRSRGSADGARRVRDARRLA